MTIEKVRQKINQHNISYWQSYGGNPATVSDCDFYIAVLSEKKGEFQDCIVLIDNYLPILDDLSTVLDGCVADFNLIPKRANITDVMRECQIFDMDNVSSRYRDWADKFFDNVEKSMRSADDTSNKCKQKSNELKNLQNACTEMISAIEDRIIQLEDLKIQIQAREDSSNGGGSTHGASDF